MAWRAYSRLLRSKEPVPLVPFLMIEGGSPGFLDAALVPVLTVIARLPTSATASRGRPDARDSDDRKFGANGNKGWRVPSGRINLLFGRQKFHRPRRPQPHSTSANAEPGVSFHRKSKICNPQMKPPTC